MYYIITIFNFVAVSWDYVICLAKQRDLFSSNKFKLENKGIIFKARRCVRPDKTRARPLFKWNDEGIARFISRNNIVVLWCESFHVYSYNHYQIVV